MTRWNIPISLPITLESVLQALGERDWVKIANNTWFLRREDGEASVKLLLSDIIRLHRDGSYTLYANGLDMHATYRKLSELAPVEVFMQHGSLMYRPFGDPAGRPREFYDGIRVDRRGLPMEEAVLAA
ncbi:MAG: hypothetical protein ABIY70_13615 [Capsulimonas sp.]|uniref:hypothetical protein n=1 Tax=Capsulimonas sp. TaxID=2494211 RepID=UPI003264A102